MELFRSLQTAVYVCHYLLQKRLVKHKKNLGSNYINLFIILVFPTHTNSASKANGFILISGATQYMARRTVTLVLCLHQISAISFKYKTCIVNTLSSAEV